MMINFHSTKDHLLSLFFTSQICLGYKRVGFHEAIHKLKLLTNTNLRLVRGFFILHRRAFLELCSSYFLEMMLKLQHFQQDQNLQVLCVLSYLIKCLMPLNLYIKPYFYAIIKVPAQLNICKFWQFFSLIFAFLLFFKDLLLHNIQSKCRDC